MLFECTPNAVVIWSISHPSSNNRYKALCFMSGLIARYTMYVQGEYNNDWERVGDEESCESISGIFRIFRIFAIFEPPQTRGTRISEMSNPTHPAIPVAVGALAQLPLQLPTPVEPVVECGGIGGAGGGLR